MGRKSKLTDKQWSQIEQRLLDGEGVRQLAREFGVAPTSISNRFSGRTKKIKDVANQLATAEVAFSALPISAQINARALADRLKSISNHLAGAAEYGAATAHRLSGIANAQVDLIDDAEPEKSTEALQRIAVLTKIANGSSEIGINLLRANKEAIDDMNRPKEAEIPAGLEHFYGSITEK